jgi:hypothetical protein
MPYCAECGVKNEDSSRFCQNCGAKFEAPAKDLSYQTQSTPSQPKTPPPQEQYTNPQYSSTPATQSTSAPIQQQYSQNLGYGQPAYQQPPSRYQSPMGYQQGYPPNAYTGSEKNMAFGIILSFFIPGLGVWYAGSVGKGILYFFGVFLLATIFIGVIIYIYQLYDTYKMIDLNNKIHYGRPIY